MGLYRTEIRSRSFYLIVSEPTKEFVKKHTPERVDRYVLRILADQVPHIMAALDQVTSCLEWYKWAEFREPDTEALSLSGDKNGSILFRWATPVHEQRWNGKEGDDMTLSTEIDFQHVNSLRSQLQAVAV
ncbi:hypothetical protein ADK86_26195 [Streptomyces sp. NRRL F-5755]|uniref:hypothetical protein n=1 Tax=Streptomyces sp. NRRL F-5755 TaxID=1519475 RepID=UPI0006AE4A0F|nr:hypothetical protein [Streptomyces sp. NRRL F-5755]KOT90396.1 hypothetical protein ADK86_26195 [Streptomyces sp. NRRL F-5755]